MTITLETIQRVTYMMLASALTLMMDKTECVFFLNTPESIKTEDVIKKTASPWIYHEITMLHLIQKNRLNNIVSI
jgi:hypothetical protein